MADELDESSKSDPWDSVAEKPSNLSLNLSYVSMLLCVCALAVDYSVVMPSLWLYLRSIDPSVGEYFLGLSMGSFSLASLLASPMVGYWLDTRPIREVVVAQLWICVAGNLLYSCSSNIWMVLLGRFICGFGSTVFTSCSVYIIRTTTAEERSAAFAKQQGLMFLGLLVGPAINYPLSLIPRAQLLGGLLLVSSYSAVGFVMAMVLLITIVAIHAFMLEPPPTKKEEEKDEEGGSTWRAKLSSVANVASISLLVCTFVAVFNQVSLETALPPITLLYWQWGQLQDSIMYCVLTAYLMVWFVFLSFGLTKWLQDRTIILIGWLCVGVGVVACGVVMLVNGVESTPPEWQFFLACGVLATSIPFFNTSVGSLFSKLIRGEKLQGRAQSVLNMSNGLAVLLGPVVSTPLLNLGPIYLIYMVGGLWVLSFTFYVISYRHLVETKSLETLSLIQPL